MLFLIIMQLLSPFNLKRFKLKKFIFATLYQVFIKFACLARASNGKASGFVLRLARVALIALIAF
jgi:hypothetical protein